MCEQLWICVYYWKYWGSTYLCDRSLCSRRVISFICAMKLYFVWITLRLKILENLRVNTLPQRLYCIFRFWEAQNNSYILQRGFRRLVSTNFDTILALACFFHSLIITFWWKPVSPYRSPSSYSSISFMIS